MKSFKQFKLAIYIALTQLRAKITQTIIAIVSVIFGVSVFIYIVGYINGANEWGRELTLVEFPDIRLFNELQSNAISVLDKAFPEALNSVEHVKPQNKQLNLKDGKQILKELQVDPRIKALSSTVKTQVYYHVGTSNINGVITGINFGLENKMFNLESKIVSGNFEGLTTIPNSLIMGERLRKRLNLSLGDKISITTDKGHLTTGVLIGTIKTGIPDIDREICYASEKTVQNLLEVSPSHITEIKITLFDRNIAFDFANELEERYNCNSSNWEIDNAAILDGAELQDMIFNLIAFSILFVAGFGIFNILNMMIYEKMKDIAIIKAMGFSDRDVKTIFISQALGIGIIGGLIGVFFGFLFSYLTSLVPYESEVFVSVDHVPMNFGYIYYVNGFLFAIITTFFAGYLPARKASKVDPIKILKS